MILNQASPYFLVGAVALAGAVAGGGGDTKSCRAFFQSSIMPQPHETPTNSHARTTRIIGVFFTFSMFRSSQDLWVAALRGAVVTPLVIFSCWYQCLELTGRTKALAMKPTISNATIT